MTLRELSASCSSASNAAELRLHGRFALAECGHPDAEFLECEQLFLVGLDQACARAADAHELALESGALLSGGVGGAQRL